MGDKSDLSYIEINDITNPTNLFHGWIDEAREYGVKNFLMNLATTSKNGIVNNRTVVITDILPDASLAFITQVTSNKIKDLNENPLVAATILLMYKKNDQSITRQVRVMGVAERLSKEQCKIYFQRQTLSAKIRSWICKDCKPTEWNQLKAEHDKLLKEVIEKKRVLEMPDTLIAYKLVPKKMDFYSSDDDKIADRVIFILQDNKWNFQRIMT